MKLAKNTYPTGHGPKDFKCFGPPALMDGQFTGVMIADLGFFDQSGKDSAKFYHGAVVQSKIDQRWYFYREWGRTGAKNNTCQFESAVSREDAQALFAAQMHDKNDKRGMWATIAGIKTLTCKPGKDCYLVRPMATRITGLPDAATIVSNDGAKIVDTPVTPDASGKIAAKVSPGKRVDPLTIKLLRDLGQGTVQFTRSSMADASIPTQRSIDEARQMLDAAVDRVSTIGGKSEDQVADKELLDITSLLYKRIPKKKERNASVREWILSIDNIGKWRDDLDAFEGALYTRAAVDIPETDPYDGMNIEMEYILPNSPIGEFLRHWWPTATRNAHTNMNGEMEILNAWVVHQHDGIKPFSGALKKIHADKVGHRPLHQPTERLDLDPTERSLFDKAHAFLGFHGTRSVNVSGILRKRLLLPKNLKGVAINGALLGPGLYWADDIKKSCQYVSLPGAAWSKGGGAITGRSAFMFIADVILGNPYLAPDTHGYTSAPSGYHSVFGKGKNTPGPGKSTAALANNEWVVYDQDQHRIRYLLEFHQKPGSGTYAKRFT